MSAVHETIAKNIRNFRIARGWSVRQLAEECAERGAAELTHSSLTNIERHCDAKRPGRRVAVDELVVLADVFDVTPNDLFDAPEWTTCQACNGTGRVLDAHGGACDA